LTHSINIALFLIPPVVIGYLVVHDILPRHDGSWNVFALKCFLGVAIGFGLTSFVTYWLLVSGFFSRESQLLAETMVIAALVAIVAYMPRSEGARARVRERQATAVPRTLLQFSLAIAWSAALIIAVLAFATLSSHLPHGVWDGWAIWNLRAKFLFHGATHWTDAFSKELFWSHPDYPLLIPTNIARGWMIVGHDTVVVPILFAAVFTFGVIGLAMTGLSLVRDRSQALLAGMVLLGTPLLIARGAAQEADVPLAFYFLSFFVVLALRDVSQSGRMWLLLGLSAGLTLWVKNEGSLFFVSAGLCLALALSIHAFSLNWRNLICFFSGALPGVLLLAHFKSRLAPQADLFANQTALELGAKLLDMDRHATVQKEFFTSIGGFGEWLVSLPIALLLYFLIVGRSVHGSLTELIILPVALLTLTAAGYYFVYIITPYDLNWHLATSLNRLLLQLWPSALFLYFRLVRTPQEIAQPC
jgi:hypothetical protein